MTEPSVAGGSSSSNNGGGVGQPALIRRNETNDNSTKKVPSSTAIIQQQQQREPVLSKLITSVPLPSSQATPAAATNSGKRPPPLVVRPAVGLAISTQVPRRARPLRPSLMRQVVVAAGPDASIPIELAPLAQANSAAAAGHRPLVPPKRPAHLPARYDTLHHGLAQGVPVATGASSKPNRYSSWATHLSSSPIDATAAGAFPHHHQHHMATPGSGVVGDHHTTVPSQRHPHHHHHFSLPFEAASRVLVVNPMQMVNLSEHTKSRLIKIIEALKRFSEQWFSHVLLLMFLAVYACFGAYIFISFEAPTEQWEKQLIIEMRQRLVNETWHEAHKTSPGQGGESEKTEFVNSLRNKLEEYERLLNRACASGMTSSSLENQWTFWGALFYSMTVFTTIGYGHLTPITFAGRVATMVYAIFGIPILLMVLADLGKLLTRIIKYAFKKFRLLFNKLLHRKTSIRTRKMISDNTSQYIGVARDAFERGFAHIHPIYSSRFPHAFTRAGSIGRRFYPAAAQHPSQQQRQHQATEVADAALDCDLAPDSDNLYAKGVSQLQQQQAAPDAKLMTSTEVIVTPTTQTKPVSPQPSPNDSLGRKSPLAAHAETHAQHHHSNNHPTNHHHHHKSGGNKVHSAGKRKDSLVGGVSSAKSGKTTGNGHRNSMSRSSSSSVVVSSALQNGGGGGEKTKAAAATKAAAVSPLVPSPTSRVENSNGDKSEIAQRATGSENGEEIGPVVADELTAPALEPVAGHEQEEVDAGEGEDDDDDEILDEFDIPVSFALFLLVTYMMFGAVVFSIWEGWNFFDSLYFVFISMSTIGFGDLVPQHPKRMIGTFIYLLFGLALTSMCINVVQEKIHATFLRAKMQIGEKMGLDLDQIMADDYYDGSTVGLDGDDCDDFHSAANLSQTNSTSGHLAHLNSDDVSQEQHCGVEHSGKHCMDHGVCEQPASAKQARNKDSLRGNKRRLITGLPAHNGPLLRRSQSKKSSGSGRQATPPVLSQNHSGAETPLTPHASPASPTIQQQQHSVPKIELAKNSSNNSGATLASFQQPGKLGGVEQSSDKSGDVRYIRDSRVDVDRGQLVSADNSRPVATSVQLPRSLSSDMRHDGGRNSTISRDSQRGQARSAGSSRRTSVSHELNELDDLISKLSKCQSSQERFGPLLGIPNTSGNRFASRSNSPNNNSPTAAAAATRRGTSMTYRPNNLHLSAGGASRKRSLQVRPSNHASAETDGAKPIGSGEVKYSAV